MEMKKLGIKPSVVKRANKKLSNQKAVEKQYYEGKEFPSSNFKNELEADCPDLFLNKGKEITPIDQVSEDVLKSNVSLIKPSWSSGKRINMALNAETGEYTNTVKSDLTIAAYRVKVNKSSDISNATIEISHDALVLGDPMKTSAKSHSVEFEDNSNEIEVVVVPWILDDNGVKTPVVLAEQNVVGKNALKVTGMLTGMSLTVEAVSKMDILSL